MVANYFILKAVAKMIQACIDYSQKIVDMPKKLELIDTLLKITDGKIFVECERARLTRMLADIKERNDS